MLCFCKWLHRRAEKKNFRWYSAKIAYVTSLKLAMGDSESSNGVNESNSESYESSSEEEVMFKPVFVSKDQRNASKKGPSENQVNDSNPEENKKKELTLKRAGQEIRIEEDLSNDFGGVDDTDDLDPAKERQDWRARETNRYKRDRQALEVYEKTMDERIRRDRLTEEELVEDFKKRQNQNPNGEHDGPKELRGAFFHDDEDISKLMKRSYSQADDDDDDNKKDHSRPTKLKFR